MKAARVVVLGIALAAGGLAAFLAGGFGGSAPPPAPEPVPQIATAEVLVAAKDVGIGTVLAPQDLQWQVWPASAVSAAFISKKDHPDALQQYVGGIVRVPMAAGEPVRDNKVIRGKGSGYLAAVLPSGMRAYSTEISAESGAGGFILPNDHVDVILSARDREAEKATGVEVHVSRTILSDVRVLAIDQLIQEKDGQHVVVGKTATLELTQRQAELLATARQIGSLSLTLRSLVDANAKKPAEDPSPRNRLNTIRFGVTTSTVSR
ncbi:MAG TPA: Flp pilus assembly protein CpaB [Xanthobacteraceae bacterium]|nr:Flp pilus assembly protein CpaB [Xanthobacteraceae bacterium]